MLKYQKYVNAMFFVAALAVWFVARHYTEVSIGYFQLGRKIGVGADVILHLLPILIGVGTFAILRSNPTSYNFTLESVGELVKVSWPGQKEVRLGTIVVILTVIIAGIVLGLTDLGFTALIRTILAA